MQIDYRWINQPAHIDGLDGGPFRSPGGVKQEDADDDDDADRHSIPIYAKFRSWFQACCRERKSRFVHGGMICALPMNDCVRDMSQHWEVVDLVAGVWIWMLC